MTLKRKLFIFIILFLISIFYKGSSFDSIFPFIEDFAQGNYYSALQANPNFEKSEDFIIYNLICIKSSLKTSNEIPQNILDNFAKVEKPLKDYLFLEAAKEYAEVGDYKKAENFIEKVNFSQIKNIHLLYESLRLKARIYNKQNFWDKEALVWSAVQRIPGIHNSKKLEAVFKEAVALKNGGFRERAKILFEKIAFDENINPFGSRAFKEYRDENPEKIKSISLEKKYQFSKQFVKNGRSRDAVFLLSSIDEKIRDVSLWANALYRARENEKLFEVCDKICLGDKKASSKDIEAVLKGLWATLRTDDLEKAKKYFEFVVSNSANDSSALSEANYAFGSLLFSEGKFRESVDYFQKAASDEKSKFFYNALFKEMLSKYSANEKDETLAKKLILKSNPFRNRASFFWTNFMKSEGSFKMDSKSFYSAIQDEDFSKKVKYFFKSRDERMFKGKVGKESIIFKLYKSGFLLYALNEAEKLGKDISKDDRYTIKAILAESGNFCKEFNEIDENIVFSHPAPYFKEISEAAEKNNIEKSLMFAICRNESRFDPFAYSNTGAVGLFQVMPETAKLLLGREVSEEELIEPKFNAEVAAMYLKKLQEIFPQRAMVAASYNAGEDVVLRWKNRFPEDEILFIMMIPYFETQNYTESVLFDKMVYDCLEKE